MDTDPHVRCIEDLIHNLSPKAVPLTQKLGINSIKRPPVFSTKYEWLEDELPAVTSTCDTVATTNGTTVTCSTAADSKYFRTGHVIRIDDENMWVSASDYAGDLTVTRAFGGTTGATHATGSTIYIVGIAMIEGADAPTGFKTDITTGYNYTPPKRGWVPQPAMAA
jgi:hypothetical protein